MSQTFRWIVLSALAGTWSFSVEAAHYQVQFPLSGRHGYRAASGSVKFFEKIGESKSKDGTTVIVEVSNVPLPVGTELIVYIHEVEVGTIKLNKQRAGRLVLESKFRQS